jgi:type II restriction enzyme
MVREKRLTTSIFDQLSLFTETPTNKNDVCVFGLIKNNRTYRFVPAKYIDAHINTDKFKVLLPKSNGSGALGEVVPTAINWRTCDWESWNWLYSIIYKYWSV